MPTQLPSSHQHDGQAGVERHRFQTSRSLYFLVFAVVFGLILLCFYFGFEFGFCVCVSYAFVCVGVYLCLCLFVLLLDLFCIPFICLV